MVLLKEQFEEARKKYGYKNINKNGPTSIIHEFGGLEKIQEMLVDGYTIKEIAKKIGVSRSSVYSYITNRKTNVTKLRKGGKI